MNISDIYSAKGLKFKLNIKQSDFSIDRGALCKIETTQKNQEFFVSQYGANVKHTSVVLCESSKETANYINDIFAEEKNDIIKVMFIVDDVYEDCIEIQTYIFQSVTEYKTPIEIVVSNKLLEDVSIEKLDAEFVWKQLGTPAVFCLNYKAKKKQRTNVRFVGGKRALIADRIEDNNKVEIFAQSINYVRDKYDVPVDVYIAPEIKFVTHENFIRTNDKFAEDLNKINSAASYFEMWGKYDLLNKNMMIAESEEFGDIKYSSYNVKQEVNGTTYTFYVDQELDDSFKGKEIGIVEEDNSLGRKDERKHKQKQINGGQIKRIEKDKIVTYKEFDEGSDLFPKNGVIQLYTAGDKYIMARRLAARDRILGRKSEIKYLSLLIEKGVSEYEFASWETHKGVTERLRRNFHKANLLNPAQIAALELAINTPDIALIQGPPGTGKTTVIKAICERFREIFEAEEKRRQKLDPGHSLQSPKILISSFQNDAVDNAISSPLPGDIPAYRKIGKRVKNSSVEQYQLALGKWYDGLCQNIKSLIEDDTAQKYVEETKILEDAFFSYKKSNKDLKIAQELIKKYLGYVDIPYNDNLVKKAEQILHNGNNNDDIVDPIVSRLENQRTDIIAFEDDGLRNAKKLLAYLNINDDINVTDSEREAIELVCTKEFSQEEFAEYVKTVESLKNRFCVISNSIDINDENLVNECILDLSSTFHSYYGKTFTSIESKKSIILSEFLFRLEQDYEVVVKKYSMTTAATCQTSLDLREPLNKKYDLVVVDEAARANPLDLFIPMSMGKKIILVGDHKQLPHMLEPDVLRAIKDRTDLSGLEELEMSLFERLFELMNKGSKPKAIALTDQYRMHPVICKFVSEVFYDGLLKTAPTVSIESKCSPEEINNGKPLTLVNVPITKGAETSGVSKMRWAEVEAIGKDVCNIIKIHPKAEIGIITFYAAQAKEINMHLATLLNDEELNKIEIGTVDAFQGKEFDYVLLSCVRSNKASEGQLPRVGFLEKTNRLCVAFSRAIRQLIVYCDIETVVQIPCFSKLYEICTIEGGGHYREY